MVGIVILEPGIMTYQTRLKLGPHYSSPSQGPYSHLWQNTPGLYTRNCPSRSNGLPGIGISVGVNCSVLAEGRVARTGLGAVEGPAMGGEAGLKGVNSGVGLYAGGGSEGIASLPSWKPMVLNVV